MRFRAIAAVSFGMAVLAIAGAMLYLRSARPPALKEKAPWKMGFWVWAGEPSMASPRKSEIIYLQIQGRRWPEKAPAANEYVIVRRMEPGHELTRKAARALAEDYRALTAAAGDRRVTGLQLDYDSPTNRLKAYARFLEWLREELPPGSHISITALLDWFTGRTAIAETLAAVDEFVPQFYDVGDSPASAGIALPIDAAKWAPVFNAFSVPYRIGISSFGRVARKRASDDKETVRYFRDANAFEFADRAEFRRSVSTTTAGEIVARYDVVQLLRSRPELVPGDIVEITFPQEASVREPYEAARRFEGYCAGVIFFRWPTASETLALTADEVERIVSGQPLSDEVTLETRDGSCIERRCWDLYLHLGRKLNAERRRIAIRAIGSMDLFLPDSLLSPQGAFGGRIFVNVPAYAGLESAYLGRAISSEVLRFEVINHP